MKFNKMTDIPKNDFYTYIFLDPRKPGLYNYENYSFQFEPLYIGKGNGRRISRHFSNLNPKHDHNKLKSRKLKKILKNLSKEDFKKNYIIKIKENATEKEAFELETKLILLIGRIDLKTGPLANLTNGGDGPAGIIPWNKGKKCLQCGLKGEKSPNYKKRPWNYGKSPSASSIYKMRMAKLGKPSKKKGTKTNPISIAKMTKTRFERKCGWKKYLLTNPNGQEFIVYGQLKKFCKEHYLRYDSIFQLLNNDLQQGHHKGWTVKRYEI